MNRKALGLLAVSLFVLGESRRAEAVGTWVYAYGAASNMFDFSVGHGILYWVGAGVGSPAYYNGGTGCAQGTWSSLSVSFNPATGCDFSYGATFPYGHAMRVAVGANPATDPSGAQLFVATAEGDVYDFSCNGSCSWNRLVSVPAGLPTGNGSYGVLKLVYEAENYYTGAPPSNPVWMLGSNHHIYRLIGANLGTSWEDVSNDFGLGPVAHLSYSAMYAAIVCTWADGTSAYYDDNANGWYYVTPAATVTSGVPAGPQTAPGYSSISVNTAAGGLFQAWNMLPKSSTGATYTSTFVVGLWPNWYSISSEPTLPGYPPFGLTACIDTGCSSIWSWYTATEEGRTGANAAWPDEEIPIDIVEGNFMALDGAAYGGGPHDAGSADVFWVLTDRLRVYSYEDD